MNMNGKKIIELLEEIRDLLKEGRSPAHMSTSFSQTESGASTDKSSVDQWDDFFKGNRTKNPYYIIALAVHYLTKGDAAVGVKKKDLRSFLEENVIEMNGVDVGTCIGHTVGMYGYINSAGYGAYKINAVTREIVSKLPDEDALRELPKKYTGSNKRKGYAKKETQ